MEQVTVRLPAASPHTYRRYLTWAASVERFIRSDPALEQGARDVGGPLDALPTERLASGLREVEEDLERAVAAGKEEVAPLITADPVLLRLGLTYSERRWRWLRSLEEQGEPVPAFDPDVVELRTRIAAAVEKALERSPMLARLEPTDGPGGFRLIGEIDLTNAQQITDALRSELDAGFRLTLDLSGVTFIDSNGLRMFLTLARKARSAGLDPVVLVAPSRAVTHVLEVAVPSGIPGIEIRSGEGGGTIGPQGLLFFCL